MQTKKKIYTTDIVFKRKMIFSMNSIYQLKWRGIWQDFYDKSVTIAEAVARKCSVKKVFLKISQHSQENTCAWGVKLY